MLGATAFVVTLFVCVQGGQELLMCALKSIGVFFLVRIIGHVAVGVTGALEQAGAMEPGETRRDNN